METQQILTEEVLKRAEIFLQAPLQDQNILPTVLPLIMGAVIMELYFGKHKQEDLGWNTSVGNAVIWMTTGISLLMAESLSQPELYATYGLIGVGAFIAFMDFFHIWPSTVAFIVSSSAVVYTLAYTLVVIIKSGLTIDQTTFKAAAIFFIGTNVVFKIIQSFEKDADSDLSF